MSDKIILMYNHRSEDTRPLPERIVSELGGTMDFINSSGKRLYSVVDWVYWVSGSTASQKSLAWRNLKRSIENKGDFKGSSILTPLSVDTDGGKQVRDFTDEHGLYLITQRMSDSSEMVRKVKQYLADAGVYVDAIYRDKKRYQNLGKSDGWIAERIESKVTRNRFTDALRQAIASSVGDEIYGHATNELYKTIWERTAKELREDLGINARANLRDHMGELALLYTRIAESVCSRRLGDVSEVNYFEALEIVKEIALRIHRQAKDTSDLLGINLVTERPLLNPPSDSIA